MNKTEAEALLALPLPELIRQANEVRKKYIGNRLDVCTIINAKSGLCKEDCKFCAQSARHNTGVAVYSLKSKNEIVDAAKQAKAIGAQRFGIVTSGNVLTDQDLDVVVETVSAIVKEVGLIVCASLGALKPQGLKRLKTAGLTRYHHNIETSLNFYPRIVSTHSFAQRLDTIKAAQEAGLEVCSGGIIGMGETWQDRIDMVLLLESLKVDSVPINILVPIKGTPFENNQPISCLDVVKTLALFRIILKDKTVKIAAGRESVLKDFQAMGFMAGANGMLIGGYLTVQGRSVDQDQSLIKEIKQLWNE